MVKESSFELLRNQSTLQLIRDGSCIMNNFYKGVRHFRALISTMMLRLELNYDEIEANELTFFILLAISMI